MIHVLATVEVAPGQRAAFLDEFRRVAPLVRAEPGCLEYGPAVDLATDLAAQVPPRDDVVTVLERWESLEALRAHLRAPPHAGIPRPGQGSGHPRAPPGIAARLNAEQRPAP